MIRAIAVLLIAIACVGCAHAAAPIAETLRGTFASGAGCADPDTVLHVTSHSLVFLNANGPESLVRIDDTQTKGAWTVVFGTGDERPRYLLRRVGSGADAVLEQGTPLAAVSDKQLPGNTRATRFVPCDALPASMAYLHGEGIAFLHALEAMEGVCAAGAEAACLDAFFAYADVTKTGRLSAAELARAVRGATWTVQMAGGTTDAELAAGLLGSAVLGLAAAELFIESFDYDMSHTLTKQALMLDRVPFPTAPLPPAPTGAPMPLEAIGAQLGPLKALFAKVPDLLH